MRNTLLFLILYIFSLQAYAAGPFFRLDSLCYLEQLDDSYPFSDFKSMNRVVVTFSIENDTGIFIAMVDSSPISRSVFKIVYHDRYSGKYFLKSRYSHWEGLGQYNHWGNLYFLAVDLQTKRFKIYCVDREDDLLITGIISDYRK